MQTKAFPRHRRLPRNRLYPVSLTCFAGAFLLVVIFGREGESSAGAFSETMVPRVHAFLSIFKYDLFYARLHLPIDPPLLCPPCAFVHTRDIQCLYPLPQSSWPTSAQPRKAINQLALSVLGELWIGLWPQPTSPRRGGWGHIIVSHETIL